MNKKIRTIGVAAVVAIWAELAAFSWYGPKREISEAERRPLAQLPEIQAENILSGKFMAVPKRFILVSNTEGDNFVNPLKQQTKEAPEILYLKSGKYRKRSTAGDILDSEEAQQDLKAFLEANP